MAVNSTGDCFICGEDFTEGEESVNRAFALSCTHTFCAECWIEHMKTQLSYGVEGVEATCMQEGCNLKITHTAWTSLLKETEP